MVGEDRPAKKRGKFCTLKMLLNTHVNVKSGDNKVRQDVDMFLSVTGIL